MTKRHSFAALLIALMLCGCTANPYRQDDDSITVKVSRKTEDGPRLVRLQVMGEKLIHVSATPERRFADPESLVILPAEEATPFTVSASGDTVTLSTSAVKANVLISTGEVWFTDLSGITVLREEKGGGKTFEPIEVDGTRGWTFRQVFESPEDEAFYGLGQHQADEFNYKGKNEELFQYNTKVSVPFILSNKGYGILMDSYSMMRFGNPDDYSQLPEVFKVYDKEGKEGGFTGTYMPADGEALADGYGECVHAHADGDQQHFNESHGDVLPCTSLCTKKRDLSPVLLCGTENNG